MADLDNRSGQPMRCAIYTRKSTEEAWSKRLIPCKRSAKRPRRIASQLGRKLGCSSRTIQRRRLQRIHLERPSFERLLGDPGCRWHRLCSGLKWTGLSCLLGSQILRLSELVEDAKNIVAVICLIKASRGISS